MRPEKEDGTNAFGLYVRQRRATLAAAVASGGDTAGFSLRAVARAVHVQPSYLSKVEVGQAPPSDELVKNLAVVLDEDPDLLMALAGKVSADLRAIIVKRPRVFATLLRDLRDAPDDAILRVVREVRDGQW